MGEAGVCVGSHPVTPALTQLPYSKLGLGYKIRGEAGVFVGRHEPVSQTLTSATTASPLILTSATTASPLILTSATTASPLIL